MTTGPEHYLKSADLIAHLADYDYTDPSIQPVIALQIAEAQVHAILAQAAATALGTMRADEHGMPPADHNAWIIAVSGDKGYVESASTLAKDYEARP